MQINRLMEIIFTLLSKERATAKELAAKFNVSERTIYRDVDTLSLANIPIVMTKGNNGGISLLKNFKIDKAILSEEEKQEVLSSLNIFGSLAPESNGAVEKLRAVFGGAEVDWLEIDFDNWSNEMGQRELFSQIKSAIINKKEASFTYHSMSGNGARSAYPLKLCFKGQAWYLYAFCLLKQDYRFFKLNRIRDFEVSAKTFKLCVKEKVLNNLKEYQDTLVEVKLKINKEKAFRVYDEFKEIEVLESGDFIVNCKIPKGDWLYTYIASFLGDCEVLEPKEIKDTMTAIYKKALANI